MTTRQSSNLRRTKFFNGFLIIVCLARYIETAPLNINENSTTIISKLGLLSKVAEEAEVGNPEQIGYDAWILFKEDQSGSQPPEDVESAPAYRRIKPKSIFVAPNLTAHGDGNQDDTNVQDVNIDHQAQRDFLVQRLQFLFNSKSHGSSSVPSGPFQLNLPLTMIEPVKASRPKFDFHMKNPVKSSTTTTTTSTTTTTTTESSKIESEETTIDRPSEEIFTVYELNENENKFFLVNDSSKNVLKNDENTSTKIDVSSTIANITNDSDKNLSIIVDYKIPIVVDEIRNFTIKIDDGTKNDDRETSYEDTPILIDDDYVKSNYSPAFVLLLTPTKTTPIAVPITERPIVETTKNDSENIAMKNSQTIAIDDTEKIGVTDPTVASTLIAGLTNGITDSTTDSTVPTDFTFDDDFSTETIETPYDDNYEESTENEDEILKHSEAGMTVTLPSVTGTSDEKSTTNSTTTTTTVPSDSNSTGNREITSEVIVNRDFVRETTLVDFNINETTNPAISTTTDSTTILNDNPKNSDVKKSNDRTIVDVKSNVKIENNSKHLFDDGNDKIAIVRDVKPSRNNDDDDEKSLPIGFGERTTIVDVSESTENYDNAETMMASSTNVAGAFVTSAQTKNRRSNVKSSIPFFKSETTTAIINRKPLVAATNVYDYETRDYYQRRHPYGYSVNDGNPVIRTFDNDRYRTDIDQDEDRHFFNSHNQQQQEQQQQQQEQQKQQQQQQQPNFVRFPTGDRRDRPNFVRFPTEEANSIHPNDHKDRRSHNRYHNRQTNYVGGSPSTRVASSSPNDNRKQSARWLPPGWRTDQKTHNARQRSRSIVERPRNSEIFWTGMPLITDPSSNYRQQGLTTRRGDRVTLRKINYRE